MVGASANSRFKDQGNTSTTNIVMKGKRAEPNEGEIQKKVEQGDQGSESSHIHDGLYTKCIQLGSQNLSEGETEIEHRQRNIERDSYLESWLGEQSMKGKGIVYSNML